MRKKKSVEEVLKLKTGWQKISSIQTKCDGCGKTIILNQDAFWREKSRKIVGFWIRTEIFCRACAEEGKIILEVNGVIKA